MQNHEVKPNNSISEIMKETIRNSFERTDFSGDIGGFVWVLKDSTGEDYELDQLIFQITQLLEEQKTESYKQGVEACKLERKNADYNNNPNVLADIGYNTAVDDLNKLRESLLNNDDEIH